MSLHGSLFLEGPWLHPKSKCPRGTWRNFPIACSDPASEATAAATTDWPRLEAERDGGELDSASLWEACPGPVVKSAGGALCTDVWNVRWFTQGCIRVSSVSVLILPRCHLGSRTVLTCVHRSCHSPLQTCTMVNSAKTHTVGHLPAPTG